MRHRKKFNHLGRKTAHRSAMLSNMAISLIMHKRIFTTVPKAKELRRFVEPIITVSKEDSTNSRRYAFRKLQNKYAVTELFQTVSQKIGERPGGYTRIIKTGSRLGDNAAMCFIELVDFNENMLSDATTKKAKTRRSRRGKDAGAVAAIGTKAEEKAKSEESKEVKKPKKAKETEAKAETKKPKKVKEAETKEKVDTKAEVETTEVVATTEEVKDKKTETKSSKAKEEVKKEAKDDKTVEEDQKETPSEEKA